MVVGGFAQLSDVGVKSQMSVKSYTQVGNCCGEGYVLARCGLWGMAGPGLVCQLK